MVIRSINTLLSNAPNTTRRIDGTGHGQPLVTRESVAIRPVSQLSARSLRPSYSKYLRCNLFALFDEHVSCRCGWSSRSQ